MVNPAQMVINRVAGNKAKQFEPKDPAFEVKTDSKGRQKRHLRDLPEGLTPAQGKLLRKIRRRAHRLDKGMSLCGFRVGWTFWLGLIPFAGDAANFFLSYNLVIKPAESMGLPPMMKERMLANQLLATGVGFIPFLGDVLMATVKPNSRNAWLLEEYLVSVASKQGKDRQVAQQVIAQSKRKGFFSSKTGNPAESHTATSTPAASSSAAQTPHKPQIGETRQVR